MNIIEACLDKRLFGLLFKDIKTWYAWFVFLKCLFGLPLEDRRERQIAKKCTGRKTSPRRPAREAYVIAGRRSGKSFISALIAVFLACFFDWIPFLSPGERGRIFIVAVDKAQAKIIKEYISAILNITPNLQAMIEKDLTWEIELINRVNIEIKTASYRGVRGYTILAVIAEELAFWRDLETSANPAKEILAAIRPAMSTVANSLLIGISTPHSRSGLLWEMYQEYFGVNNPDILIWKSPTILMNPTIDKREIKRGFKEDKSSAEAEWMGRFRQDLESYLSADLLDAAIEPGRHSLPRIADVSYFGFCDPSGGRRDSMTLAIAHVDQSTKKVILDRIEERRAPFKPQEVVQDFSRILRLYGLTHLSGDRYSGVWVSSEFANCGVMYEASEISTSEFYLSFLPLISNGNVELLDDKRLIAQLKGLERRTRVGSRDLITHYPGGFDDLAASCAGVCVNAFNQSHDIEFNHLVEELTRRHYEAEMESELTDEEKLDRRMMKWLVGGELEPPDDLKSLPDEFESICNTRGKTSLELDDGVQKTRRGKKDEAFIEVLRYGGKDERQKI